MTAFGNLAFDFAACHLSFFQIVSLVDIVEPENYDLFNELYPFPILNACLRQLMSFLKLKLGPDLHPTMQCVLDT